MKTTEGAVRKRLSNLWGVEPYRLDVQVLPDNLRVAVDGKPPTAEQTRLLEEDIIACTAAAKLAMN